MIMKLPLSTHYAKYVYTHTLDIYREREREEIYNHVKYLFSEKKLKAKRLSSFTRSNNHTKVAEVKLEPSQSV